MPATASICKELRSSAEEFVGRSMPTQQLKIMESHLEGCGACQEAIHNYRAVHGLLEYLQAETPEPAEVGAKEEPGFFDRMGGAPWWAVSAVLHVLVIALAGLISMAIELPKAEESIVMVTELAERKELNLEPEKPQSKLDNALASKHDTPPTDPLSNVASDIVVPPDILAKAEIGDHFETINPDRPDTQSAFGNPDAHMFHSVQGNDEPPGGGGVGGTGLDELIGVGGTASLGSGGGWGGGNGTGTGVDNGSGHGSFGNRNGGGRRLMVMRHGGSKKTEDSVDLALQWLAYHQEPDGHWDVKKYEGGNDGDTAMSGLALLCFLGAGHTEKVGKYKDNVLRAVSWLKSQQKADGGICKHGDKSGYSHGIATMALCEAAGMANIKETKDAAQKAVNYCIDVHQNGEGSDKFGWRYTPKSKGDISVSGWFVMALKSAKVAGLHVDPAAFEGAFKFLESVECKDFKADGAYDNGRHRYGYLDGGISEVKGRPQRTTIGCLCQLFMGTPKDELLGATQWFMKTPGDRGGGLPSKDNINAYYFYYGTLVTFQMGGDEWKQWNEALKPVLVDTQRRDGDFTGSWDHEHTKGHGNPWGDMWGRVGQTALHCLCLEVYYRYAMLHP